MLMTMVMLMLMLMVSRVAIMTCGGCMLLLLPAGPIDNIHSMMNTPVGYAPNIDIKLKLKI